MKKNCLFPKSSTMKFASIAFFLITFGVAGCSTRSGQIGAGCTVLKVGREYVLKRNAILLGNRGEIDSVANPDFTIENFKPYKDFDPYWTETKGVVPAGTVIAVREIRLFKHEQFRVIGEIMDGDFKRQPLNAYKVVKGATVGPWPSTGQFMMNNLCGGKGFDASEVTRNISEKVD